MRVHGGASTVLYVCVHSEHSACFYIYILKKHKLCEDKEHIYNSSRIFFLLLSLRFSPPDFSNSTNKFHRVSFFCLHNLLVIMFEIAILQTLRVLISQEEECETRFLRGVQEMGEGVQELEDRVAFQVLPYSLFRKYHSNPGLLSYAGSSNSAQRRL